MESIWQRVVENLVGRLNGPFDDRLIMEPLMATMYALIDGIIDARKGQPAYFWAIFAYPERRHELVKAGWKSAGKMFAVAGIIDVIYQLRMFHWVYPFETIIVACVLAIVPYVLLRGLFNRIARMFIRQRRIEYSDFASDVIPRSDERLNP